MHRVFPYLERHWCFRLAHHLVAMRAPKNRDIALAASGFVYVAKAAIPRFDLIRFESSERRVISGKLEQLFGEHLAHGDNSRSNRGGLRGAARECAGWQRGVPVFKRDFIVRYAEPFGSVLSLNRRGAHAHFVTRHLNNRATISGEADARRTTG